MKTKKITAIILAILTITSVFVISITANADTTPNYVLLGDSIARGAGIYNSEKACYGRIVADTNGYNYANYAVDGARSTDLLQRLNVPEVAKGVKNADIISISIGGNDYLQQNLPKIFAQVTFGNYKIVNDVQEIFRDNFTEIMEKIKELNPDAVILMQTLYNPRTDLLRDFYGIAVTRVNLVIEDYLCEHPGAYEIVDVYSVLTAEYPEYIALDSIHPSSVGNEEIAKLVLAKLYELGLGENTEPAITTVGMDQIPYLVRIIKVFRNIFNRIFKPE